MAARGKPRPGSGRPPGRRGRGGVGPGPGYKTGGTGKGSTHKKSSSTAVGPVAGLVFAVAAMAVLFVGTPVAYLIWAYV